MIFTLTSFFSGRGLKLVAYLLTIPEDAVQLRQELHHCCLELVPELRLRLKELKQLRQDISFRRVLQQRLRSRYKLRTWQKELNNGLAVRPMTMLCQLLKELVLQISHLMFSILECLRFLEECLECVLALLGIDSIEEIPVELINAQA